MRLCPYSVLAVVCDIMFVDVIVVIVVIVFDVVVVVVVVVDVAVVVVVVDALYSITVNPTMVKASGRRVNRCSLPPPLFHRLRYPPFSHAPPPYWYGYHVFMPHRFSYRS